MEAKSILKQYWNFDEFRSPQQEIIQSILSHQDVIAILPTGGGKSICYQVPALLMSGITLVITPLIALMEDQVKTLQQKNIAAQFITNEMDVYQIATILEDCQRQEIKLLYISPERLQSKQFIERLQTFDLSLVAVDEAHCISQWGHDFRPAYRKIAAIRVDFPNTPILALTATATPIITKDIEQNLELKNPQIFKSSLIRENLTYFVRLSENKKQDLLYYLQKFPGSSIVFCKTRKQTYEIATFLIDHGIDADYFHAKLDPQQKKEKQAHWTQSNQQVMVSTNAFGMGIDKPNVRTIFHLDLPSSIEAYYQEVGRAGRDGLPAQGIYLFNPEDIVIAEKIFKSKLPTKNEFVEIGNLLFSFLQIAEGEIPAQLMSLDVPFFAEKFNLDVKKVFNFIHFLHNKELIFLKDFTQNSTIQILVLPEVIAHHYQYQILLEYLERNYPGIYTIPKEVYELKIAFDTHMNLSEVRQQLHAMHHEGIIDYSDRFLTRIKFLQPRETNVLKNNWWKQYEEIQLNNWKKLEAISFYAAQHEYCRERMILSYFGEKSTHNCGNCDVCTANQQGNPIDEAQLLAFLGEEVKNIDEILMHFINSPKEKVIAELQYLLDEMKIIKIGLDQFKKN